MTAVLSVALALANFLMGANPATQPFRAVAFLLSLAGHRRAGALRPITLHRNIRRAATRANATMRTNLGLDYDPLDIVEFNSFDDLISKRAPGGAQWQVILLITHASGAQPTEFTGSIFLGDKSYDVKGGSNDILDAINRKPARVDRFRAQFDQAGRLRVIGCGVASTGPDVAIYLRELFGTEGEIVSPVVNVDFTADGRIGTPRSDAPNSPLRNLADDEWDVVPAKDVILNALDPLPQGDL